MEKRDIPITDIMPIVAYEMAKAHELFGRYHSAHECYGVLAEELAEWFDEIRLNAGDIRSYELIQLASVAIRYAMENGSLEIIMRNQRDRWHEN
jgi:hypothetical protein